MATLSISCYDLGCATGEMAYKILVNGAAKSTTLNAIAGVWPVDEGQTIIDALCICLPVNSTAPR